MADIRLTCAETPLKWPATVALTDIPVCSTCAIQIHAPQSGSLQILTRRAGDGVGDGVNIDESNSVGADYRAQRYTLDEAILNVPGLHVFPGQTGVYPAEYHLHMKTYSAPQREITIVIPVSHRANATAAGATYFAATAAQPDPAATRPTLETLFTPGTHVLQYQGPDLRGRTDTTALPQCASDRQFLLVLSPVSIRATDLERIPREGSLSTNPRDLPALGAKPTKTVTKDRLMRVTSVAVPGIGGTISVKTSAPTPTEIECKPLRVVDGRDVVDVLGKTVDVTSLFGAPNAPNATTSQTSPNSADAMRKRIWQWALACILFMGVWLGLILSHRLFASVWSWVFTGNTHVWDEKIKNLIFVCIALSTASSPILSFAGIQPS